MATISSKRSIKHGTDCTHHRRGCSCSYVEKEVPDRHADPKTLDHLIALTKLTNRYTSALIRISNLDGNTLDHLKIARLIAREALFPEKELPYDESN
jgi:hypothetical protein